MASKKKEPKRAARPFLNKNTFLDNARPKRVLNEEVCQSICKYARRGIPASTILDFLGIPVSAFHEWMSKAKQYEQTGDKNLRIYGAFLLEYRKACAKYLMTRQTIMENGDPKEYYREVVILERRDRKNWGKLEPAGGDSDDYDDTEKFI